MRYCSQCVCVCVCRPYHLPSHCMLCTLPPNALPATHTNTRYCTMPCWKTIAVRMLHVCLPWRTRPKTPQKCSTSWRSPTTGMCACDVWCMGFASTYLQSPTTHTQWPSSIYYHRTYRNYLGCSRVGRVGALFQQLCCLFVFLVVMGGKIDHC